MIKLNTLEEIRDLRTVWPKEALDFTPWLAKEENMLLLANTVGIDISVNETEAPVGGYRADIYAYETGTDRKIIIENQLEDTNHEHLGKLITYASGKGADIVIWVVKQARDKHRSAVEWLNNHTDKDINFFLCEIKLYKIGSSEPAVKFEIVEQPNDWSKEMKKHSGSSETEQKRYDYWVDFQEYAFKNESFANNFNRRKPSFDHWKDFSIGVSGAWLAVSLIHKRNELDVELYIADDKDLFNSLFQHKDEIEAETGLKFDWKGLPNKKGCRIVTAKKADLANKEQWPEQFNWLIDTMLKMKKAFKKYL